MHVRCIVVCNQHVAVVEPEEENTEDQSQSIIHIDDAINDLMDYAMEGTCRPLKVYIHYWDGIIHMGD